MTAPIASGGSDVAGWGLHPLESAAFARRTPRADVAGQISGGNAPIATIRTIKRAELIRLTPTMDKG